MNSFKYNLARRFSGALLVFHMGFRPQMVFARIYTFPNQQYVDRIFENKYTDIKMHTTTPPQSLRNCLALYFGTILAMPRNVSLQTKRLPK